MAKSTAERRSDLQVRFQELREQSDTLKAKCQALRQLDVEGVMVRAIKTDLKVGLTFAGIALHTRDDPKRQRNRNKARTAYDTVRRFCRILHLSADDRVEIEVREAELRAALQQLGESV